MGAWVGARALGERQRRRHPLHPAGWRGAPDACGMLVPAPRHGWDMQELSLHGDKGDKCDLGLNRPPGLVLGRFAPRTAPSTGGMRNRSSLPTAQPSVAGPGAFCPRGFKIHRFLPLGWEWLGQMHCKRSGALNNSRPEMTKPTAGLGKPPHVPLQGPALCFHPRGWDTGQDEDLLLRDTTTTAALPRPTSTALSLPGLSCGAAKPRGTSAEPGQGRRRQPRS